MRIGVFVGSFNPVHKGHLHIVNYLLNNNIVDKVFLLATPNYWDKQDLVDIKDRVNMLKLYENDNIIVDDIHNKYSYTYEVLRSLKRDYKDDDLYLIIGADNLINLDKWKNVDEILTYKIIVLNRDNIDIDKYLVNYDKDNFIILRDFKPLDISSTKVRNGNLDLLDERVKKYITNKNLYRGN